jgi:hypothetical protein
VKRLFSKVLVIDQGGMPKQWASYQEAIMYVAKELVVWTPPTATTETVYGGTNAESGLLSSIDISSIMAVRGPMQAKLLNMAKHTPRVSNRALFERDHNRCAYCGNYFDTEELTRDHITPKKSGGKNTWMNLITACKPCNGRKADRTPEKANMYMRYKPYMPSQLEYLWFGNRHMTEEQQEYMEVFVSSKKLKKAA